MKILIYIAILVKIASAAVKNGLYYEMIAEVFKRSPTSSLAVSPLALRFPLCKLTSVAEGRTKDELMTVLGIPYEGLIKQCYDGELKSSLETFQTTDLLMRNEIYVNYTDGIQESFINKSMEEYGVNIQKVGFVSTNASVDFINKRISTLTYKRIPPMLKPKDINRNTTMVILNSIHLKTTWESPFYIKLTTDEYFFYTDGKRVKMPMMRNYDDILYFEDKLNSFSAFSIHFMTGKVSFNFFVPDTRRGLKDLLGKIAGTTTFLETIRKKMKYRFVKYSVPRFKMKTVIDWTGFLKKIGVWGLFNCNSTDLKNMMVPNNTQKICLHRAKSTVFIDVDEHGSYRHPEDKYEDKLKIDNVKIEHGAAPDVVVDRPFYFTVSVHGNEYYQYFDLIHGTYYGPEA